MGTWQHKGKRTMKVTLKVLAGTLFAALILGTVSCSSDQQQLDEQVDEQVDAEGDGQEDPGYDESNENYGNNYEDSAFNNEEGADSSEGFNNAEGLNSADGFNNNMGADSGMANDSFPPMNDTALMGNPAPVDNMAPTPADNMAPAPAPMTSGDKVVRYVTMDGTPVYGQPSEGSSVSTLSQGEILLVSISGEWAQISPSAFVSAASLSEMGVPRSRKANGWR
jgi:hypothetical protein